MGNEVADAQEQSSMDHWWPRLKGVDVMVPETVAVEIAGEGTFQDGLTLPVPDEGELRAAIETVGGPPAFLRSDVTSTKHDMGKGSRVETLDGAKANIAGIVEQHHLAWGMPMPSTYYVREWLDLDSKFRAWAYDHHDYATPIAPELRFFLLDGEIHDFGFYWPKDAIRKPDTDDWEAKWEQTRDVALNDHRVNAAETYARRVAEEFDTGYWSVDFALTRRDQWYAIDMARGELSFHPESVERAVADPRAGA